MKVTDLETLNEIEYLGWVIMEALRMQSPTFSTSYLHLTQDAKIGHINIRKGDTFIVNSHYLHSNGKEWQRPDDFIPERFDDTNPISLTPGGKKRNPGSWVPFYLGKRACFGKIFAEASLKIVAIYFCHYFNFSFVEKRFETEFPVAHCGMSKRNKIEIILTKENQIQEEMARSPGIAEEVNTDMWSIIVPIDVALRKGNPFSVLKSKLATAMILSYFGMRDEVY